MKSAKPNAFCIVSLLLGLVAFAMGSTQGGGLRLIMQQIEVIGPRQWFGLVAGSLVASAPLPVSQRIAGAFVRRAPPYIAGPPVDAA